MKETVVKILLVVLLIGIFALWKGTDLGVPKWDQESITYEKGIVTGIIKEEVSYPKKGLPIGFQEVYVKLKNSEEIRIKNILSQTHSILVKKGTKVIVTKDAPEGVKPYYSIYNYNRHQSVIIAILIFCLLLVAIGKVKGMKSLLALVCSVYIIFFFMVPLIYTGHSPILITIVTAALCSIYTIIILYGIGKMALVNLVSIPLGFVVATGLFLLVSSILHVSGFHAEDAEALIVTAQRTGLQIKGLLFSGVAIASLGAAMDVSVSISSALNEINSISKSTGKALFTSGMNIGKDILGTMVNTLIFAFIGGSIVTVLILISYGVGFNQLTNSDFFATEVLRALIGTTVVVLMVPITSLFSGFIFNLNIKNKDERKFK